MTFDTHEDACNHQPHDQRTYIKRWQVERVVKENTIRIHQMLNLMKGLYKSVEREWEDHAQKYGMTNAHLHVLWILYLDDGIRLSDLAAKGLWNLSTTQDIVNRMDQRGLVKKEKDMQDGRVTRVYITEEGKRLRAQTQKDCDEGYPYKVLQAIDSLSEEDQRKLKELTRHISESVLDQDFMEYVNRSARRLGKEE
jgi:DNA-binding MarR family transcriptional regulator